MDRSADYSIQGFHYQFNKTLLEVLKAADDAEITVEGIVEDIEITEPAGITAIQCKYHEARESYAISGIYKPLLQMMLHFHNNQQANIRYIIFAHFPNPPPSYVVSRADLEAALASKNDKLRRYCDALNGQIDLDRFLPRISVQFGESWDAMITSVHTALLAAGIPKGDIDTLAYPNAIQAIANLSMQHDINQRRITKAVLVAELRRIKSTAITRWTLALKTKKQLLEARRKQLKGHLDKNARLRYFIVNCASLEDFDTGLVSFVYDFLAKYHFKPAHICTPVLCLDTTEDIFQDIQLRLHKKGVIVTDGVVGRQFDEAHFFRKPLVQKGRPASVLRREFDLRMLRWDANGVSLSHQKADDLFILGSNRYVELDTKDVCVEVLETTTIKEVAFVTGVNQSHE